MNKNTVEKIKSGYKIIILIFVFSLTPLVSNAQVPFGGIVLFNSPCASGAAVVYVYDYFTHAPLPLLFRTGFSYLHANYNFFTPGNSVLGTWIPNIGGPLTSFDCVITPVGIINTLPFPGIGTSAVPSF